MADLRTSILDKLALNDPFMIASSHWTATEPAFRQLNSVQAAAVTLKTVSEKHGGDGKQGEGRTRSKYRLQDPFGSDFAYYTDGPKPLEFWNLKAAVEMTAAAKRLLPTSALGLSVLAGEDYPLVGRSLDLGQYQYVELNWKYTFRTKEMNCPLEQLLDGELASVATFFDVFGALPVLVKLSRESLRHLENPKFHTILELIKGRGGALLVANTLRTRVPPSRRAPQHDPVELNQGVVFGEHLFIDTYNSLRSLSELGKEGVQIPPMVASGGIVDIGSVVDSLAAGAQAVQLCSALDLRLVDVVDTLREELGAVVAPHGSLAKFITAMRESTDVHQNAIQTTRKFVLKQRLVIQETLSDPGKVNGPIKDALLAECTIEDPHPSAKEHGPLDGGFRFAITFGNVSACVLANHCVNRLRLKAIDLENMSEFRKRLKSPGFEYDFVIIPEASLRSIQSEGDKALGTLFPVPQGKVARSIMELVGVKSLKLEEITTAYHFSGSSATETLQELKTAVKAPTVGLSIADCYPMFRFWKPQNAILAKPPLSCFYGLFTPPDIADAWGAIWHHSEPLWLVASTQTLTTAAGREAAKAVLETIEAERQAILRNPEGAIRSVEQSGFVRYCEKLLGSKVRF